MVTRRQILKAASIVLSGQVISTMASEIAKDASQGLVESRLIYITPILSNGETSRCQAEVWFVANGLDLYVSTPAKAWRAQAPRRGLDQAYIWVGDVGPWTRGDYQSLPRLDARVALVNDPVLQDKVLDLFSVKYAREWRRWKSSFVDGTRDGSRAMLHYRVVTAQVPTA